MDRWETVEEIAAARARFETGNPGYRQPVAHGLIVGGSVAVWNEDAHMLPAAVMASVLGHDGSTAALVVSRERLDEAIELLAPAEACSFYDHPNLAAWRAVGDESAVAVFVGAETR